MKIFLRYEATKHVSVWKRLFNLTIESPTWDSNRSGLTSTISALRVCHRHGGLITIICLLKSHANVRCNAKGKTVFPFHSMLWTDSSKTISLLTMKGTIVKAINNLRYYIPSFHRFSPLNAWLSKHLLLLTKYN